MIAWLIRLGDALSQFGNVLIFGGDSNHSISGDAWRFKRHRMRKVIDFLFYPFERDHCYKAHLHDIHKASRLLREWNDNHTLI